MNDYDDIVIVRTIILWIRKFRFSRIEFKQKSKFCRLIFFFEIFVLKITGYFVVKRNYQNYPPLRVSIVVYFFLFSLEDNKIR